MLGGELEEAVRGDPTAEEYASQFRTGMTAGLVLTTVGTLGMVGGLVLTGAEAAQTTPGHSLPPTGLVVCGVGLVTELVGLIVALNAAPHLFDAINAYNDAVGSKVEAPTTPVPAPSPRVLAPGVPSPVVTSDSKVATTVHADGPGNLTQRPSLAAPRAAPDSALARRGSSIVARRERGGDVEAHRRAARPRGVGRAARVPAHRRPGDDPRLRPSCATRARSRRRPPALRVAPEGLGWFVALVPITPAIGDARAGRVRLRGPLRDRRRRARARRSSCSPSRPSTSSRSSQLSGAVWHDMHLLWMAALLAASPCDEALAFDRRGAAAAARFGALRRAAPLRAPSRSRASTSSRGCTSSRRRAWRGRSRTICATSSGGSGRSTASIPALRVDRVPASPARGGALRHGLRAFASRCSR